MTRNLIRQIVPDACEESFDRDGYAILPQVFSDEEIEVLITAVAGIDRQSGVRNRGGVYAVRNLLCVSPSVNALAHSHKVRAIAGRCRQRSSFPVRGMLFDKTNGANWLVPWHQDLTICVASRIGVDGYKQWSVKAGVCHVQPPVSILENLVSVRIHLDDCAEPNGALRVLPGTHRMG